MPRVHGPAGVSYFCDDGTIVFGPDGSVSAAGGGGGGPTSGDVNGTLPGPYTVVGLQGVGISATPPTNGQALVLVGGVWTATTLPAFPASLPPSGPAGGDLRANYPNPIVQSLQTVPISLVAPTNGQVLQLVAGVWTAQTLPSVGPFAVTQDLSGNVPGAITVVGLQTRPVSAAAPGANTFLGWNGAAWAPLTPVGTGPFAVTGDVTGNVPGALTVVRIQTTPFSAVAPTAGQIPVLVGGVWTPSAPTVLGVEPATPATIPLRTAAGGVRANALSADVGDLLVNHTNATATVAGAGASNVYTAQNALTNGDGGEHVFVGCNAASTGAPFIGGGFLFSLGASAGGDPIGATFRVLTSTGDLVIAGGVRGVGVAVQSQDVIIGHDLVPEADESGSIGGNDLQFLGYHAGADGFVAHGDNTNTIRTALTVGLLAVTNGAARSPLEVRSRDLLLDGQIRNEFDAVTFAAPTTTVDLDLGGIHRLILTADTAIAFSNLRTGGRWVLELVQDATGGRAVTWPTIVWPNGVAPVLSRASNARDVFTFFREGGVSPQIVCESFVSQGGTALGYQATVQLASGANYTARVNDYIRQPASATAAITLPDASTFGPNHAITYKESGAGTSAITFNVAGGGTIDGAASYVSSTARAGLTFVPAGVGTNVWDAFPPA